ncbi:MAG: alpha-L-arabinofuranosidase [Ruminococcaceae bacterium]|nr:alpha-L-arabinofuranosidase [Oscillospiraceae bacterium]
MREEDLRSAMAHILLSDFHTDRIWESLKKKEIRPMRIQLSSKATHTISPYLYMQFLEPLGTADSSVDAAWDYLNNCWQPVFIEKYKQLAPPMLRFGGCFASYYHWKEAVGPRESRIPMLNLCWDGLYSNQVGTDEVISLCRESGSEPLFVVNMESDGRMHWAYPKPGMDRLGTAAEAAEWVDYCNNPDNALRRSHGIADPYNIRYWQIGNETSYDKRGFDAATTARKTKEFARAMREADPTIKLLAWSDSGWTSRICETAGEEIDYLAFHHHFNSGLRDSPLVGDKYRDDPGETWYHLMNAHRSLVECLDRMREEAAPYGKRLAMTEGHFSLHGHGGRNCCEVLSTWGAGVSYARCLNVIERNADILDIATMADFVGNRWQVNTLILPTPIRSGKAYFQPVGEIMRLFRHHIGTHAVKIDAPIGVDATASISADGNTLYVHLVNPNRTEAVRLEFFCDDAPVKGINAWFIAEDSMTEVSALNPNVFTPVSRSCEGCEFYLPPAGVAALEIPLCPAENNQ